MLKLRSQPVEFADFVSHGEFALYSASLLAPVFFTILRDLPMGFPYRLWIGLGSLVLLLFATLTFAGVFSSELAPETEDAPTLNIKFLIVVSVILYLLSLGIAYGVTVLDMVRPTYNPHDLQTMQIDNLNAQMRSAED